MARTYVLVAALVAVFVFSGPVVAAASPAASGASGASAVWTRPVPGPVTRPFLAPVSRYGAGHRGADLAAAPGTPVVAAGDGIVAFAGTVANTRHVVVAHAGRLHTGYSFLAGVDVAAGNHVRRGQRIGIAGGSGPDHAAGAVHFSLRVGDTFVDPMQLFAPPDLTRVVHLAPVRGNDDVGPVLPAHEERVLAEDLGSPLSLPAWSRASTRGGGAGGGGGAPLGAVSGAFGALVRATAGVLGDGVAVVEQLASSGAAALRAAARLVQTAARRAGLTAVLQDVTGVAARLVDWARSRLHCTADPPDADGTGGSGHALMVVAGISSSWDGTGNALGLPARDLGYDPTEVRSFSYRTGSEPYSESDTWGDLVLAARRLGEQLRAMERERPGREVDLVAHSQGGVVVDVLLKYVYDPADARYPPLGTIVTLSSPHEGAPLATAAGEIRASTTGRRVLDPATRVAGLPPAGGRATNELSERSSLLRDLWKHRLPDHVEFTSIGAPDDVVVPASQIDVAGGRRVVVDPAGAVGEHDAITHDRRAMRAVRLALEGRPPACVSFTEAVRDAIEPVVITRAEHGLGHVGGALGAAADALAP